MILTWIIVVSLICSLIYTIITHDYIHNEAMWGECIFPGIFVWKRLKETKLNIAARIAITCIAWITLFMYSLILVMFGVFVLMAIGIAALIEYIIKGG